MKNTKRTIFKAGQSNLTGTPVPGAPTYEEYMNANPAGKKPGKGWDFANNILQTISSFFQAKAGQTPADPYIEPTKKDNTLWILLGVVAVLVGVVYFTRKK